MSPEAIMASVAAFLAGAAVLVGWNAYTLRRYNEKLDRELSGRREAIKRLMVTWEERLKGVTDHIDHIAREQTQVRISMAEIKKDVEHIKGK